MERCKKHPKFKGNKAPKYQCPRCFAYYLAIKAKKPRALPMPTKVVKSKKVYDRKKQPKSED